MPSFTGRVRAALALSRLLGSRPPLRRPVDWPEVTALANEQQVAPLLYARAREALPPSVAAELRHAVLLTATHNLRWRVAIGEVVGALNAAGVVPLLIKGGALLSEDAAGVAGWRYMIDLDIVVPDHQRDCATAALERLGYENPAEKPFQHIHETVYVRPGAPGQIELHHELGGAALAAVLPVTDAWADSREVPVATGTARVLSATHAVLHNVLHSVVQDFTHAGGGLPLRQLATLRAIADRHAGEIDWAEVDARMTRHGLRGHLTAYVWLAHRYAGLPMPAGYPARRPHELLVLTSFGLRWPMPAYLSLRYALGPEYMRGTYGEIPLAAARARHVRAVLRRDGRAAIKALLGRGG